MSYHVQVPGELSCPEIEDVQLDAVLSALAEPQRRGVITALVRREGVDETGERACSTFALPVAKSTRTYHWRVLREAGLIRQRDAGNGTFVRLRPEFDERFPGLLSAIVLVSGNDG